MTFPAENWVASYPAKVQQQLKFADDQPSVNLPCPQLAPVLPQVYTLKALIFFKQDQSNFKVSIFL